MSNRTSDGNGTSDSNGMGDSNRTGDGMADNTVADSDSDIRVGSSAVVGDLGNKTTGVISVVVDVLDPAVGKVDRVGALPETSSIVSLGLLEGSARELISHTILVGVGGDLSQVIVADSMGHRVSHSMHHRSGHGVHHRTSHSHAMTNSSHEAMSSHKTMSSHEASSSQQLGGGRGGGSQGRDAKEGLHGCSGEV